jgi:hypothetical protein
VSAKRIARDVLLAAALLVILFSRASGQVPASKAGLIRDGSYENLFLGLTYTPDSKLIFNTAEFSSGRTFTERTFVMFSAWEKQPAGQARMSLTAYADRLSDYPEASRTAEAYLYRVSRNQLHEGYEVVKERTQRQLANTKFVESEFRRGQASEAVLVTLRKGYALVFIFTAADSTDLEKLVSSSRLAFGDQSEH